LVPGKTKINLNMGFGAVLVPNIQRVPVPKPVFFGKVPGPGLYSYLLKLNMWKF